MRSKKLAVRMALSLVGLLLLFTTCGNPIVDKIMSKGEKPAAETPVGPSGENPPEAPITYYTVTFMSDGVVFYEQSVGAGERAARPSPPTKDGSYFEDWYTNGNYTGSAYNFNTPVTAHLTLYAKWNENFFTVTFMSDGNIFSTQNVGVGGRPTPGNPLKAGYTLAGWFRDANLTDEWNFEVHTVAGDIILYAKWVQVYTVTFNSNGGGGTIPIEQTASAGSSIPLPSGSGLSRTGYTFDGWNTEADGTGTNYNAGAYYTVIGSVTLYAKWSQRSYQLKMSKAFVQKTLLP